MSLSDTGYTVVRDGRGGHLVFDTGAHGFLNGGHAHADALAVTLTVGGRPVLIDPGTGTYTMDSVMRDRFRGSLGHNTLTLDGRSSSEPAGPFHWRTRGDARLAALRANRAITWSEASHDGYGAVRHRRSIVHAGDGGWFVLDEVVGRGRHLSDLCWHFDPVWQVSCESKSRLRIVSADGAMTWLLHEPGGLALVRGDEESGLGWCAPLYGRIIPTWTARFTHTVQPNTGMFTWIAGSLDDARPPVMERVHAEHDPGAPAFGACVRHGDREELVLLRPGDTPRRDTRSCSLSGFNTDARLLHVTRRDEQVVAIAIADGAYALALADGLVSVAADRPLDDLHVGLLGDVIELTASAPPPRLQVQGAAVSRARLVRVNGREVPLSRDGRVDRMVVTAADWAAPVEEKTRATCVA